MVGGKHHFSWRKNPPNVIQENLNPIAELERSSILMASTIHGESIVKLLKDDVSLERLRLPDTSRPKLLQKLKELSYVTLRYVAVSLGEFSKSL